MQSGHDLTYSVNAWRYNSRAVQALLLNSSVMQKSGAKWLVDSWLIGCFKPVKPVMKIGWLRYDGTQLSPTGGQPSQ